MLKGGIKRKFKGMKFVLTNKALKSFNELKSFFPYVFILVYYDLMRHIMLECNVFRFAISMILLQIIEKTSQWHPVAF